MSELYNRIESLCKENGSNITEMCRQSGAPRGSLSDLKAGKTNRLNTTTLSKIAAHFGVSVDYLLGNEPEKGKNPVGFVADEAGIDNLLRKLTPTELAELMGKVAAELKERGLG